MATFVLIHGAGSDAQSWGLVTPLLEAHGDEVIAVNLPVEDESAQLEDYAQAIRDQVRAAAPTQAVILVAQSLAGFPAPMVVDDLDAKLLVLLCAMIPNPGESAGQWWVNTGSAAARRENDRAQGRDPDADFDPMVTFLHDLEPMALSFAMAHPAREQSNTIFEQPFPLERWPDVATEVLIGSDDRFFPPEFMRRVSLERLGVEPDVIDCGHVAPLAAPRELARRLINYKIKHVL